MRSIGKGNRNLVVMLTKAAMKAGLEGHKEIEEAVIRNLSEGLWDTWEMADNEIRSIIWDTVFQDAT